MELDDNSHRDHKQKSEANLRVKGKGGSTGVASGIREVGVEAKGQGRKGVGAEQGGAEMANLM